MIELLDWFIHNPVVEGGVLLGILWLIARDEANLELGNMMTLLILSLVLFYAVAMCLYPYIGLFAILVKPVIFVFLIKRLCWVPLPKAIATSVIYVCIYSVLNVVVMFAYYQESVAQEGEGGASVMAFAKEYLDRGQEDEELEGLEAAAMEEEFAELDTLVEEAYAAEQAALGGDPQASAVPVPTAPAFTQLNRDRLPLARRGDPGWEGSRTLIDVTAKLEQPGGKRAIRANGTVLAQGGILFLEHQGMTYRWRLQDDEALSWERVDL